MKKALLLTIIACMALTSHAEDRSAGSEHETAIRRMLTAINAAEAASSALFAAYRAERSRNPARADMLECITSHMDAEALLALMTPV